MNGVSFGLIEYDKNAERISERGCPPAINWSLTPNYRHMYQKTLVHHTSSNLDMDKLSHVQIISNHLRFVVYPMLIRTSLEKKCDVAGRPHPWQLH